MSTVPADKLLSAINVKIVCYCFPFLFGLLSYRSLLFRTFYPQIYWTSPSPFTNQKYLQLPQQTSCTTSLLTATCLPDLAGVQDSYDLLLSENQNIFGFVFLFFRGAGGGFVCHIKKNNLELA